jgi:hypothetical protein
MSPFLNGGKGEAEGSSCGEEGKDKEKGNALGGGGSKSLGCITKLGVSLAADIAHAKHCRHVADDLAFLFVDLVSNNGSEVRVKYIDKYHHDMLVGTPQVLCTASLHNQSILIASNLQRYCKSCIFKKR